MIKAGDKVLVVRPESTRRQSTIHEKAADPELGDWIDSKPALVERKGVIGSLQNLFVTVTLPNGDYRGCRYVDLTFLKTGKVSFSSRKAGWKGVKKDAKGIYREVLLPGKEIRLVGKISWNRVFIPVTIKGKSCQVPYEQLKFKKEQK